jgi:threonine synthase
LQNAPPFDGERVETDTFSMWRYRAMLLPDDVEPVTLGEGWTPLLPATLDERQVYLKVEGLNPTGSFKDRGTAVHVSILRAVGKQSVHDDSSGNAGASLAAYAARANLRARIFAPRGASQVKLAQVRLYGAELVAPDGPRSAVAHAAEEAARQGESHYASHAYNPLTVLGMKTLAYEIWEQLGSRNPDVVVIPLGHGSQLLGMAAGFRDLLEAGAIERLPRLVGVQAAACAPLWAAFNDLQVELEEKPTAAEGVRIIEPVKPGAVLEAIRESGGTIVTVEEHEIVDAMRRLARLGVMVEATSAIVIPALARIEELLLPEATVVLSLTGSGFKAPELDAEAQAILQAQSKPA